MKIIKYFTTKRVGLIQFLFSLIYSYFLTPTYALYFIGSELSGKIMESNNWFIYSFMIILIICSLVPYIISLIITEKIRSIFNEIITYIIILWIVGPILISYIQYIIEHW